MNMNSIRFPKKFAAACLAATLALVGLLNGLTVVEVAVIVAPITTYIVGQGMADFGKESK